jgi:adenosylcobinamide-GDP ribazoletransferase
MGDGGVNGLLAATAFLTRVPVRATSEASAASLAWFPVVGAVIGLAGGLSYALALVAVPPVLAASLATTILVFLTGALHEDGLADSADAWGGASSREDALRILQDPAHGTYGVVALVLVVLLRIAALSTMAASSALLLLPTAHAVSRAAIVAVLVTTPPARPGGLAASFGTFATGRALAAAVVGGLVIGLSLAGPVAAVAFALVAGAVAWLVRRLALRRIAGVTGDVLGAIQQLVEVAVLVIGAALVTAGWGVGWR